MARRRVVLVALPCTEVVEIDGSLDIFYAANLFLGYPGSSDGGYHVGVVSPATTVRAWAGLARRRPFVSRDPRPGRHTDCDRHSHPRRRPARPRPVAVARQDRAPRFGGWSGSAPARSCWPKLGCLTAVAPRRTGCTVTISPRGIRRSRSSLTPSRRARPWGVHVGGRYRRFVDLVLALVEEDFGRRVALQVAQRMVFSLKRSGGQAQFSALLSTQIAEREPFRDLLAWLVEHPGVDL